MTKNLNLPVTVCLGTRCTRDLETIEDILAFLDEWPPARRGPIRELVRRVCIAVYSGEATTEDARRAFVSYARLLNVLEPIFDPVQLRGQAAKTNALTFVLNHGTSACTVSFKATCNTFSSCP